MKVLFDTSVWVEHLRCGILSETIDRIRGRFVLSFDAVVAAELRAGCRSNTERRVVHKLLAPFEHRGRLLCPTLADYERAALSLSKLRERSQLPSGAKSSLFDALIATVAAREGALLVTTNLSDFSKLKLVLPLRLEGYDAFRARLRAP